MCGIVGFSGKKEGEVTSVYDVDKIRYLMYYNSIERNSTESSGFYKPGMVQPLRATTSAKFFLSYEYIKLEMEKATNVFIGHIRKQSVGKVSLDNTHPYKIKNIIGVHNGTINNYKELLKKYDLAFFEGRSDSYYLYQCLVKNGSPEPLRHITGSAALLFTDTIHPEQLMVYRKEKELYYGHIDGSMYISSERLALESIGCPNTAIKSFLEDIFYVIKNGNIEKQISLKTVPKGFPGATWPTASYTNKWVRCINPVNDLVKDCWYLVDTAMWASAVQNHSD